MAGLRIVHVVPDLAPGGTQRLVIELVNRTRARCESLVCCLDEKGDWSDELERENVPVVALNRRPGFRPDLGWRIASLARRHRAEVLHCHHYSPFVYGRIAATLIGAGLVYTEHGRLSDQPPSIKRRMVNPLLGRLGGPIFAVSGHLREHMIAEGLPASRIGVIHNGIDPGPEATPDMRAAAREVLGLPHDALVIGTAARLDTVKDLGALLQAFSQLRGTYPGSRLIVIGDGAERAALTAIGADLGIMAAVDFTGHRDDVRQLLPALDIFVNSSVSEGISLTILEAMAANLPVVATAVGGTPEVVIPDVTGLLVPARDPQRLAGALVQLASDEQRRLEFGAEGRRRVLARFSADRMVSDYMEQYKRTARKDS